MLKNKTNLYFWVSLSLVTIIVIALGWSSRFPASAQGPDGTSQPSRVDEEAEKRQAYMEQVEADFQPDGFSQEPMAATPCVGGMAGIYPCMNIDLMAFMPLASIGAGSGANDIWGWTDPLDGKEYALVGLTNGTSFVDVTDPENPVYLGRLPTQTSNSTWRDIKVYNDYAFVVSEASGHGMQVFDLTELRNVPVPPVTFSVSAHYSGFGNAHNIAINEDTGFAYAIGTGTCSGGLHMVNIQNPLSPTNAGCFSSDGYTHDTQCVIYNGPDPDYQGDEICFSSNEDTLTITDVTNKAAPVQISRTGYAGSAYTHQGWLTEDHAQFLLGDELDEQGQGHNTRTRIWDVSNLDAPTIIGIHDGPNASIDHNLYTHEGNAYMSNYTSGLQIYDLSDVANGNLTLLAYFDSYTANNAASFNGSWSNYPYFASGNVVHTGIGEGLFITRPILTPEFSLTAQETEFSFCVAGEAATTLDLLDQNGYTGTVTLSSLNLPVGSSTTFDPNPVDVPGSSTMTVTVSTASAGIYPFTILGDDGVLTDTVDATLQVFSGSPADVILSSPANGAVGIGLIPTFEWSAATQGQTYELEVATDNGFSNIIYIASGIVGTQHTMNLALDPLTTYYWHVRAVNNCGIGSFSSAFSFTTADIPPILLVDDDDNGPDVQATYTSALNNLGLTYDVWDTGNSDNEPSAVELAPYDVVIWFTGDEFGGAAGPGAASETALGTWLDAGGCFFISSQDYRWDRGITAFMTGYLGVNTLTNDNGDYTSVTGQGSVFGGLGPYTLTYPFTDYSDPVTPNGTAELAFQGNNGNGAALNKETSAYKTSYFTFPWEAINTAAGRETTLQTFIDWCGAEPPLTPTPSNTPTETPTITPTLTPTPSPTATEPVPTDTPSPTATITEPTPTPTNTPEPPVGEVYIYLPMIVR